MIHRLFIMCLCAALLPAPIWGQETFPSASAELEKSTAPLRLYPTEFTREMADQLKFSVDSLEKLERKGYGRTEMIVLVLLSQKSSRNWKDLIKERERGTLLKEMVEKEKLDYSTLFREAQKIKKEIDVKAAEKKTPEPNKKSESSPVSPVEAIPGPPPTLPLIQSITQ